MPRLRFLLLPFAAIALTAVIACGGDDNKASANSEAAGNNRPAASSQAGGSGSSSGGALDLSKSAAKLRDLKSFRFDMTMKLDLGSMKPDANSSGSDALGSAFAAALLGSLGDIKAEGAFVAPDQLDMKMKMAGQEIGMVQIGDKAWVKFGSSWQSTTASSGIGFGDSPADLLDGFLPKDALKGAKTSKESVNGVSATHYSFDKKALEALGSGLTQGADLKDVTDAKLDVWLSDDGMPVKIAMNMAGKDEKGQKVSMVMEMNVRDINSDSIKIKAPV